MFPLTPLKPIEMSRKFPTLSQSIGSFLDRFEDSRCCYATQSPLYQLVRPKSSLLTKWLERLHQSVGPICCEFRQMVRESNEKVETRNHSSLGLRNRRTWIELRLRVYLRLLNPRQPKFNVGSRTLSLEVVFEERM